jgi:hypothetical protein
MFNISLVSIAHDARTHQSGVAQHVYDVTAGRGKDFEVVQASKEGDNLSCGFRTYAM